MCGIAGILDQRATAAQAEALIGSAIKTLRHRGPDDEGVWIGENGIGLGHTRLSILDLSEHGHQPMLSPDGRLAIVYNGEIYNFSKVRNELLQLGHNFTGSGDTEVILHAYQEWGQAAFNRFIGMFALALWDSVDRELLLVRDRVGVKPLYFGWHNGRLSFASELKAVLKLADTCPPIDKTAFGEYLQYGYISAPRSIYTDIFKLQPGHILRVSANGDSDVIRYWAVPDAAPSSGSDLEIEHELTDLLTDAINYRMVSDVPVGIFLSGGIDSTLVASILAQTAGTQLNTFTIGFGENEHDESHWARRIATELGTNHTEAILTPRDALAIVPKWANIFDEPFGDASGIPTFLVSELASKQVKVVLSADGGDELFGGYNIYRRTLDRIRRSRMVPSYARHLLSIIFGTTAAYNRPLSSSKNNFATQQLNNLRLLGSIGRDASVGNVYDHGVSIFRPAEIEELLGGYTNPRDLARNSATNMLLALCQWDIDNYLPDDILAKVDRTTMAASIEGREPLLDHRLIEMSMRVPQRLKMGELGDKHILKSILYKYIDRQLVDRPKQGFSVPIDPWMKNELKELVHDLLDSRRLRQSGLLNAAHVDNLKNSYYNGTPGLARRVWLIVAFEMWREAWT